MPTKSTCVRVPTSVADILRSGSDNVSETIRRSIKAAQADSSLLVHGLQRRLNRPAEGQLVAINFRAGDDISPVMDDIAARAGMSAEGAVRLAIEGYLQNRGL